MIYFSGFGLKRENDLGISSGNKAWIVIQNPAKLLRGNSRLTI